MKAGLAAMAALAAAAVLAGCSRGAGNAESGDRTQVLHRGIGPDLADLDPHLWTQTSDASVLSALLEGLVAEDPVDLHPVPGVAERWEVSPDGLTYTFYLREAARWSNGEPVTADDFAASWKRMLSPALGATRASQLYVIAGAEAFNRGDANARVGVASRGAHVLVVSLERPVPWFLSLLSGPSWMPVPLSTIARYGPVDQRGNPWASPGRWVGNGPFVLESWHHGQDIVVVRSPTYWDAANVRLRAIHFHAFDSIDAEERAFRAGQLHVTETVPPSRIEAYRSLSPSPLRIDPLLGTYFMRMNVRRPGLNDARIRLALALAIDRPAIVERVLHGGQQPASAFTPPGIAGYTPQPVQTRDLERARQLLAESGHAGGAALPAFTLLYNTSELHREVAEALQEMWRRDLSVRVVIANQEMKSVEEARRTGNFDLLLSSWIADYGDPSSFLDILRSDNGDNFTGWSNPDYDSLLFRAERTPGDAARLDLYRQAEDLMLREAPIAPLYHYTHTFLLRPSVHGWHPTLLDHHPYGAVWLGN